MKKTFFFSVLLFLLCAGTKAQQSSRIMDAAVAWTPQSNQYDGVLHLYLTDTVGVTGISISIGSGPEQSDIYTVQYTFGSGGSFPGNWSAMLSDLQLNIGSYAYHADYYTRITLLLQNAETREIAIHSSN